MRSDTGLCLDGLSLDGERETGTCLRGSGHKDDCSRGPGGQVQCKAGQRDVLSMAAEGPNRGHCKDRGTFMKEPQGPAAPGSTVGT